MFILPSGADLYSIYYFPSQEERQQRLREQARRLILETRVKSGGSIESPTSPTKPKRFNFERTISPIHNGAEEFFGDHVKKSDEKEPVSPSHRLSDPRVKGSPLQSFNGLVERISPKHEKKVRWEEISHRNCPKN